MSPSQSGPSRRDFILGSTAALALSTRSVLAESEVEDEEETLPLVLSPPVVQNPTATSFSVAWRVSRLATGWVQWGQGETLDKKSLPSHHGLVMKDDRVLSVRVRGVESGKPLRYRVVTVPLDYPNAYHVQPGEAIVGEIRELSLPDPDATKVSLGMINDTHERADTIHALAKQIEKSDPDMLLWNGDLCDQFHDDTRLAAVCLDNGASADDVTRGGWASTRPLLFVPGNHDVRGLRAHRLPTTLLPWLPDEPSVLDPQSSAWFGGQYCFALRWGPMAVIGLNTGEDKPDRRDVWAGLADYEPYRKAQRDWLVGVLQRPDIAQASHLVAVCHIPLRGLSGQNDGQGNQGYAGWSGQGAALWLPPLRAAGCKLVLSGHMHRFRIDEPTDDEPITQVVGGGPKPPEATFVQIEADPRVLSLTAMRPDGTPLKGCTLAAR